MSMSLFSVCYVHKPKHIPKKRQETDVGTFNDYYTLQTFEVFSGINARGYPQFVSENFFVLGDKEALPQGYCVVLFMPGRKPGTYVPKHLYAVPEEELEQYLKLLFYGPNAADASILSIVQGEGPELFEIGSSAVM